jgi:hypothetical protein
MLIFYSRSVVDVFVRYPATSVVDVDAIKLRLAATEQAVRSHIFPDCSLSSGATFPDCSFHQREIYVKREGIFPGPFRLFGIGENIFLSVFNHRVDYPDCFLTTVARGGSFKEIELSQLS